MKIIIIGFLVFISWSFLSTYIYVCKIKGICSELSHADVETITDVLELIPGRIEEDNWVGQARELVKEQYS